MVAAGNWRLAARWRLSIARYFLPVASSQQHNQTKRYSADYLASLASFKANVVV
jgi:hypothetical protein